MLRLKLQKFVLLQNKEYYQIKPFKLLNLLYLLPSENNNTEMKLVNMLIW